MRSILPTPDDPWNQESGSLAFLPGYHTATYDYNIALHVNRPN